jgi:hypothetical protein
MLEVIARLHVFEIIVLTAIAQLILLLRKLLDPTVVSSDPWEETKETAPSKLHREQVSHA